MPNEDYAMKNSKVLRLYPGESQVLGASIPDKFHGLEGNSP